MMLYEKSAAYPRSSKFSSISYVFKLSLFMSIMSSSADINIAFSLPLPQDGIMIRKDI